MVVKLTTDMKVTVNRNGIKELRLEEDSKDLDYVVVEENTTNGYGHLVLRSIKTNKVIAGHMAWNDILDYYGSNVNNEVVDLISNHDIKSFQAVLDDGRTIHISCLN